jgi:hypothetical protein
LVDDARIESAIHESFRKLFGAFVGESLFLGSDEHGGIVVNIRREPKGV